ncbi:MAG: tail fiber protein [Bacteroidia bacterium]|nr:tail fiber protein [Bacteroidia bacterium]
MKNLKTILLSIVLFTFGYSASAQVPKSFNYMAIARDEDGDLIQNTDITVRIAILDQPGLIVWEEEHAVTTNDNGLFQLVVGDPTATKVPGGYDALTFADVNWTPQPLYIRTKISLVAGVWLDMGNAQLVSVPYAMISESAYNVINNPVTMNNDTVVIMNSVDVVGNYATTEDEALFEVKRKDGQTMFAVYNQGVRINIPMVDNVPKSVKGGFAIGGFGTSKTDYRYDLFTLNKDSVRIYLDKSPDLAKKPKGGFAIGGFDIGGKEPLPHQNYLFIAPDSARIYVKDSGKGVKGGFAIGGFSGTKTPSVNFLNLTSDNYFIGQLAGLKNMKETSTGTSNIFIGKESGKTNTTGSDNVFLGFQSGFSNNASFNSFIGYQSGKNNTSGTYNTFMGYNAGLLNGDGQSNVFIGYESGRDNITGDYNVIIGKNAGLNSTGDNNILIGRDAGMKNSGNDNIFIGVYAGTNLTTGQHNLLIGSSAGLNHTTQEYNVMLGTSAGANLIETYMWQSSFNTFMGINAGYKIALGKENVFIGTNAGYWIENGSGNTMVGINAGRSGDPHVINPLLDASNNSLFGDMAGFNIQDGDNNVAVGYSSGYGLTSGSGNVLIGKYAGYSLSTESNKLYIANSFNNPPLIYGDFSSGMIGLGKITPAYKLDVVGDVNITGDFRVNGSPLSTATLTTGNLTATGPVSVSPTRQVVGGAAVISIADASTSAKGAVQLSNSYDGTSVTLATTETALSDGLATKVTGTGMTMGTINMTASGPVISTYGMVLIWDLSTPRFSIYNGSDVNCWYWYTEQGKGAAPTGSAMRIEIGATEPIVLTVKDGAGYEIHFGDVEGTGGYCSLWLHFAGGVLTGHYIQN